MMKHKFGIIGIGLIADFHARAIAAMEKGELVACCSRSLDKAEEFGRKFGCKGYDSLEELLSHPGLEIVSICTASGAHMEAAVSAADAKKHVISEKPLEITLDRCDRMIEACEKNDVRLAGIFPSRFHDVSGLIKSAVDEKRFGKLVLCDAYVKWFRSQEYYDEGGWKGTKALDGGGALINQSIHAIDLLQWFAGPVDSVESYTNTIGHTNIDVEDNAVAALRFASGALGVIEGSTAVYPGFLKKIELSGTKGSAVLEEENINFWRFSDETPEDEKIRSTYAARTETGGGAADPAAIGFTAHQRQFENFVEALEGNGSILVDGPEARKAVEIIMAIYRSSERGKEVKLPL